MTLTAPSVDWRQAPRESRAPRRRLGVRHVAALAVTLIYVAAALVIVRWLHLPSEEAAARTVRLGLLFGGPRPSALAFGLDRPPLLQVLALPWAAVPALRADGLAAALGTAAVGGIGVLVASGIARWAGMGRPTTVLYAAGFALHPVLVYSGAIGLPEALYATALLGAFGQMLRWLREEATAPMVSAGAWVGLAVLLRYDALWLALAMAVIYYRVAWRRGGADGMDVAQATISAFVPPVLFMAGLWMLVTWIVTGDATAFVTQASRLSGYAADSLALQQMMDTMRGSPVEVAAWIGRWSLLVAAPSLVALAALIAHGAVRRRGDSIALAVLLACGALPEAIALVTGHGQPRVTHLFPLIVPAFVALAYVAEATQGVEARARGVVLRRHRVRLAGATLALCLASFAGGALTLLLLPPTDRPVAELREALRTGTPAQPPEDVRRVVAWLRERSAPGAVIADAERAGPVILASGAFERFRTPLSTGGEAVTYDPFGLATYILVRRPLEGADVDPVSKAHPGLFSQGASYATLAFEAGDYRAYRVDARR